jgi:hypothetical protein
MDTALPKVQKSDVTPGVLVKKNPLFLIGFLAGLLEELGFDEAALVP